MRHRPLCSICLMVFIVLSFLIHVGGTTFVKELRPSPLEQRIDDGTVIQVSGEIYQKEVREDYQILYLKNNSISYQEQSFREFKIIIHDEKKQKLNIGNKIIACGEASLFEEERNPGNFNQKLYYQKQDIHASVWADSIEMTEDNAGNKMAWLKNLLYEFRCEWKEKLCDALGDEDGMILAAMLLGEKAEMDPEVKELYQANGIGHILAISGLHLSFIGVGIYQLLRRLTGSYTIGGIMGSVFLGCYILMIGFTVSAVRALVMFLFRVGADMAGRNYDSLTALSASAVIVILWRPLYLYDGGFWLSFGAVLAVVAVLPVFQNMPFQALAASLSINLLLLPIQLYYFYEFPIYSIILNLWVIPLMSVIMFTGIAGSVLMYLSAYLGGMTLHVCKWIFWVYETSCELALKLPGARMVTGQPEMWQIVVYYLALVMAVLLWKKNVLLCETLKEQEGKIEDYKKRKRCGKVAVIIMIGALAMLVLVKPLKNYGKVQITVVDVGQGDGIFIRGPKGGTYLIDGGSSDIKKVGQYRLESFLKSQGVRRLDYVFVTHGDGDHTSGIEEMLKRGKIGVEIETIIFPTKEVWDENILGLAKCAMENEVNIVVIEAGKALEEGEMSIHCLAPESGFAGTDGNAASLLLGLSFGEFDMLFTGDVEAEGEEALNTILEREWSKTNWEVLKVAHHGSKNSSGEKFLEIVNPAYALISAGQDNSYGHPHAETIERLESVGSQVISTQEAGAITIWTDGEKMKVGKQLNSL